MHTLLLTGAFWAAAALIGCESVDCAQRRQECEELQLAIEDEARALNNLPPSYYGEDHIPRPCGELSDPPMAHPYYDRQCRQLAYCFDDLERDGCG